MKKYLLKRLLTGLLSASAATVLVMIMVYSLLDPNRIFREDPNFNKRINNSRTVYRYSQWEKNGYLDYVPYNEYMYSLLTNGEIDKATYDAAVVLGDLPRKDSATYYVLQPQVSENDKDFEKTKQKKIAKLYSKKNMLKDSDLTTEYTEKFIKYYEKKGYKVERLPSVKSGKKVKSGGDAKLFAYKNHSIFLRVGRYFSNLFDVDNIHYVDDEIYIGKRGLTFTLHDPLYGGEKFSPAIIGNGTKHKYLLYCDGRFPYIHQNLLTINLGRSFTIKEGVDVFTTMTEPQGAQVMSLVTYPSGLKELSADDLHTAKYTVEKDPTAKSRYVDDYTNVSLVLDEKSKVGFSFVLGIFASILAYMVGIPSGIMMARKKDKLIDKIGTTYIVFALAVPSLAYIFMVQALGRTAGLPDIFILDKKTWLMYLLPIISLALPSIGNLMKWLRRYMIDQMNSDYVRFARSGGLSEGEIFRKHIFKNAAIPIVHGIPGTVLSALVGAIITESVYTVPGAGTLLTDAIKAYDNGVIVGLTLFYALLSVLSIILGDLLMSLVDPRISFVEKAR